MTNRGKLITGYQAKFYDYRGPLWDYVKLKHLSLVRPRPNQRVLDVGCGTGKTLLLLSQKCDKSVKLYGIEPSEDMLELAKSQLGKKAKLQQGIGQALPYPDNYFDIIMSTQVLHHLPATEKKKMLTEMHRILRPAGTTLISDWGKPTNIAGKFIHFLWRNHAYVAENDELLSVASFQRIGFKSTKEISVQLGIMHHIQGRKP